METPPVHTEHDAINPSHYKSHPSGIECIEVSRLCMSDMGQAIQYIWRHPDKNGHEDLRKAAWFLRDLLAHGGSHYPPYKARELLDKANAADIDMLRVVLLEHIRCGELDRAIAKIVEVTGG